MAQLGIVTEYDSLWDPIVGATDGHGRPAMPTADLQLERTLRLKEAYTELKAELLEEVGLIESTIIRPAMDARECIAPLRKTIKKRENKRLDFEKCQEKANKLQRKPARTPKEDATLAKAEAEVARAAEVWTWSHIGRSKPRKLTRSVGVRFCRLPFKGDTTASSVRDVQHHTTDNSRGGGASKQTSRTLLYHAS